ncbi:phage tail sheath C-terminal domain-containing protein [Sphingomonas sp.]|uniref:phage tail sheath family protein n=1 Tax=Sphingomonas sp. TaxID=28214 RepID=UPI001B202F0C|nr:phage tail sheath C-terminal domain-containing protein [Sphingomonas sp.]MBO9713879.1 phage tail sheath family protein [Sphingomonas sp.]
MRLTAPGVYTRELDSGVRTIVGAPTSTALFVGPSVSGIDLRPQRIASFADFERLYGGLSATSLTSYAVLHFYANGGGEAYFIRVPPSGSGASASSFKANGVANAVVSLKALSKGLSGDGLMIEFDSFGLGANLEAATAPSDFNVTLTDRMSGLNERFGSLTTSAAGGRAINKVLNDPDTGSKFVSSTLDQPGKPAPQANGTIVKLPDIANPGADFAKDCRVSLQVDVLDGTGAFAAAQGFTLKNVMVFEKGKPRPSSKLELLARTLFALNTAISNDAGAAPKMNGLAIEATLHDGGKYARFRVSAPGGGIYDRRIYDAAVRFAEPDPAPTSPEKSWLADFTDVAGFGQKIAPARYQLGAKYPADFVTAQAAGVAGNADGQPGESDLLSAVQMLGTRDPFFNTLCLPELARAKTDDPKAPYFSNAGSIYAAAAQVCDNKFAFLIVDPPPDITDASAAVAWKSLKFPFQSSHAGAWFPNIRVDDPLVRGSIVSMPPSGAIAGMMARIDGEVGVWQAPAGTDASLNGVYGPSIVLSDDEHGLLNPLGVNCIRQFPIFGTVGFGSRTTDGADAMASDWKYIPVRRTSNYILRTLSEGLRWAVHKPNGEELWSQLRISVTAFMQGMFRQGAFKGVSARDAYFVKCDSSTTTPADINLGIVNIVIGFAPLKPAEFVVVSLRQIVQPAA